jgi:hypothetical protein
MKNTNENLTNMRDRRKRGAHLASEHLRSRVTSEVTQQTMRSSYCNNFNSFRQYIKHHHRSLIQIPVDELWISKVFFSYFFLNIYKYSIHRMLTRRLLSI